MLLWYRDHRRSGLYAEQQAQALSQLRGELASVKAEGERLRKEQEVAQIYWRHMAEELRTPLHGLHGYLHLCLESHYGSLREEQTQVLSTCLQLSQILRQDLHALLKLTERQGAWLKAEASQFSLNSFTEELLPQLKLLRQSHPELRFQLKRLWDLDEDTIVQDQDKLRLITQQLLAYVAHIAGPAPQSTITLALHHRRRLLTLEASVEYPSHTDPKLVLFPFESKHQAQSAHLLLIKTFLEGLGGELRIDHEAHTASKWTLLLSDLQTPEVFSREHLRGQYHNDLNTKVSVAIPSKPAHFHLQWFGDSPHVLVIDDQALNCELIREMLLPQGYRVSLAFGGREGLKKMATLRPDLVLLDLMMPECSGEDVLKAKQDDPELRTIPVILVTAKASDEDRLLGLDLGADDFLAKPIVPEELLLRVKNLLQRQRLTRELALFDGQEELALFHDILKDTSRSLVKILEGQTPFERHLASLSSDFQLWLEHCPQLEALLRHSLLGDYTEAPEAPSVFPLPTQSPSLNALRSLRRELMLVALPFSAKQDIWTHISQQSNLWLQGLQSSFSLSQSLRDQARRHEKAVQRLKILLDAEDLDASNSQSDLKETLTLALELLLPKAEALHISFSMPPLPDPLNLEAAPKNLLQLLLALLTPLYQQLAQGLDQDKSFTISATPQPPFVEISFQLQGFQPPPEEWESYFQRHASGVSGTSLYEARRLVQIHQGSLFFRTISSQWHWVIQIPAALNPRVQK